MEGLGNRREGSSGTMRLWKDQRPIWEGVVVEEEIDRDWSEDAASVIDVLLDLEDEEWEIWWPDFALGFWISGEVGWNTASAFMADTKGLYNHGFSHCRSASRAGSNHFAIFIAKPHPVGVRILVSKSVPKMTSSPFQSFLKRPCTEMEYLLFLPWK